MFNAVVSTWDMFWNCQKWDKKKEHGSYKVWLVTWFLTPAQKAQSTCNQISIDSRLYPAVLFWQITRSIPTRKKNLKNVLKRRKVCSASLPGFWRDFDFFCLAFQVTVHDVQTKEHDNCLWSLIEMFQMCLLFDISHVSMVIYMSPKTIIMPLKICQKFVLFSGVISIKCSCFEI